MKRNLIKVPLITIFIISFIYIISSYILENYFNLLLRDWIFVLFIVILAFCSLIIEIAILIKLNGILEKGSIKKIWKRVIRIVSICILVLANFYAFFICLFVIGGSYEEIGVEIYDGEKYVVRDIAPWIKADPLYNYHLYKNPIVYNANIVYFGEVKLGEPPIEEDNIGGINTIPEKIDEDTNGYEKIDIEEIEIIPANIKYIQKIDSDLNYGFYPINRAGHQYLYGFVKSKDNGASWEIIYKFPATSEIYYGHFLDGKVGFVNFGSEDKLSLFMTKDGGLNWNKVSIDIKGENQGMVYVHNIQRIGEKIELTLGLPSWTGSSKRIKYYSVDGGASWNLKKDEI